MRKTKRGWVVEYRMWAVVERRTWVANITVFYDTFFSALSAWWRCLIDGEGIAWVRRESSEELTRNQ